jgi:hypothetical protein
MKILYYILASGLSLIGIYIICRVSSLAVFRSWKSVFKYRWYCLDCNHFKDTIKGGQNGTKKTEEKIGHIKEK